MLEHSLRRYMRLVDELERTAGEYDAPNELIRDIPALAAVYFDKEAARTYPTISARAN